MDDESDIFTFQNESLKAELKQTQKSLQQHRDAMKRLGNGLFVTIVMLYEFNLSNFYFLISIWGWRKGHILVCIPQIKM